MCTSLFGSANIYEQTLFPNFTPLKFENKKLQAHKPDSVSPESLRNSYHLSTMNITAPLYLPTREYRTSRPQAFTYLAFQYVRFTRLVSCLKRPWARTSRFHPYLVSPKADKTVIFCGTVFPIVTPGPPVRWYVALYCPDFPPCTCMHGDSWTCCRCKTKEFNVSNQGKVYCLSIR